MSDEQPGSSSPVRDPALWVDQHGDFLFRFAQVRLGDRQVSEDLVQETFLAALRNAKHFADRSAERTWLAAILKHKIVDHLRKRGRERTASDVIASEEGLEALFDQNGRWQIKPTEWDIRPNEALERQEFWDVFRRCLSNLPHRLATVFSLREMDELRGDEVCELLNVTPGNLGVLLYRARMRLRRCLEVNWFSIKTDEV